MEKSCILKDKEYLVKRLQELYAEEHELSHKLWQILWNEEPKK